MELVPLPHFFNNKIYTIPDYQRGYSWQSKNVLDLLIDVSNAIQLNKPHYMGTINIHPQDEKIRVGVNNFTDYHVVDGQQRFTTLILILSYLLKELTNHESTKDDALDKIRMYLKNKDSYIFRYAIDKISDDYFRSVILELEKKSSLDENIYTRNLSNAKNIIIDFFKDKKGLGTILNYLNAIEEKLVFNEFVLVDGTEIGVVFETMNNRGIILSNLEIVKNRLLYLTSKVPSTDETKSELLELSNLINKKWSHILKNLTLPNVVLNENTFLANHWIIYKGWKKDNNTKIEILDEYFTISEMIKNPNLMASEIRKYIHSLAETSLIWRHLNYPEEANSFSQITNNTVKQKLVVILMKLNRISNSTIRPMILSFFPLFESKPEFVLELCELAEIFSFRLFSMNKKRSDTGKNDIFRICNVFHKNYSDIKYQKIALYYLSWYIDVHGDERRFQLEKDELFISTKKNGFYSWSGLSYFLYEYEEYLRKGQVSKVEYNFANQTAKSIEHIIPQSPTDKYWKNVLKEIPKKEIKNYMHSLGNLLLISADKNSQLKNHEYPIKRDSYKVGSYSENKVSKSFESFGKLQIEEREKELFKFLTSRWRVKEHFLDKYPHPGGGEYEFEDETVDNIDDLLD
jgi:uncharacterized protein with ParB-like and HNH nuclease domain